MQLAFYYDQSRCTACLTCVTACKDWNGVRPGPAHWRRLTVKEKGIFPNVTVFNLVTSCNHCKHPACVAACPVGALYKRPDDGIVIADRSKCTGTKACLNACPYNAPQFGDAKSEPAREHGWQVDHPVQKCTFCWDRWAVGKKPTCVEACIMRALDAGPEDEIVKKYPDAVKMVEAFPNAGHLEPSIYFKPKPQGKPNVSGY